VFPLSLQFCFAKSRLRAKHTGFYVIIRCHRRIAAKQSSEGRDAKCGFGQAHSKIARNLAFLGMHVCLIFLKKGCLLWKNFRK
jgi:hypothetical protein